MNIGIRRRHLAALALSPFANAMPALSQSSFPGPVTLLVPQSAGGSNDVIARALAARLPQVLGVNVVVENRPGANGNLGSSWVARSAPKNGTLWLVTANTAQTINPAIYKNTGFDPIADFEPVAGISMVQHVILGAKNAPANSLADLIALAKREPGKWSYASSGNGSFAHLLMEQLKKSQGIQLTHVPYKGVAQALTDLVAGNVPFLLSTIPACLQFVKAEQVKALAIPSTQRSPALPNVPLASDTVPGLAGDLWIAIYAPKGVPHEYIARMRSAVAWVQEMEATQQLFAAQGAMALRAGPAELLALTRDDLVKWGRIVKEVGITVD